MFQTKVVDKIKVPFQAIYRVIEMTEKDSKTSFTDTLIHIHSITEFL